MGPGERPQLAAGGRGSGRVHANAASGSLAQLVTLNLEELLNPAGQLPAHLPHEDPKKERCSKSAPHKPLTPWFSPLVWAMRMAGSKLEETLGLL